MKCGAHVDFEIRLRTKLLTYIVTDQNIHDTMYIWNIKNSKYVFFLYSAKYPKMLKGYK